MRSHLSFIVAGLLACLPLSAQLVSQGSCSASEIAAADHSGDRDELSLLLQGFREVHPSAVIDGVDWYVEHEDRTESLVPPVTTDAFEKHYTITYEQLFGQERMQIRVAFKRSEEIHLLARNVLRYVTHAPVVSDSGLVLNGKESESRFYFRQAVRIRHEAVANPGPGYDLIVE